jgi:uncharacterized membrane protein
MPLIDCHECGNQVSDNARACPKCGAPVIVRIRRELKVWLIMAGFAIVVAAICAFDVWVIMHNLLQKALVPLQHH